MNKESRTFYQMVRDFLTVYLPKQKAASPNTIRSYKAAINMYLDFSCQRLGISLDNFGFHLSSRELLEGFLDYLEEDCKCSVASRNQRLAAIRRFFRYASERDPLFLICHQEISSIPVKTDPDKEIEFFRKQHWKLY